MESGAYESGRSKRPGVMPEIGAAICSTRKRRPTGGARRVPTSGGCTGGRQGTAGRLRPARDRSIPSGARVESIKDEDPHRSHRRRLRFPQPDAAQIRRQAHHMPGWRTPRSCAIHTSSLNSRVGTSRTGKIFLHFFRPFLSPRSSHRMNSCISCRSTSYPAKGWDLWTYISLRPLASAESRSGRKTPSSRTVRDI